MIPAPSRRAILAGGLCALAGRGGLADDRDPPPSAASQVRPAIPRRDASGLQLVDPTGAPVPLARFAGEVLVVNLWATWCLPCRREMPSLARLAAALDGAGVRVLPLAFEPKGPAGVRRFYREIGVNSLPVLLGDGQNLKSVLGIERLPTTLMLDAEAHHIATVAGEARWDDAATQEWLLGLV